jgi:hypothetical protein
MKKVILAAFIAGLISSCIKQNPAPSQSNPSHENSSTLSQISSVTTNYVIGQSSQNPNTSAKALKWLKVLGADLTGALTGGATGFGIGSVAPGVGSGVGMLIGAVVGGAGASCTAAGSGYPTHPNDGVQTTANRANNFDAVGFLHYAVVDAAFRNQTTIFPNGVNIDYNAYYNLSFQVLQSNNVNAQQWIRTFAPLNSEPTFNFEKSLIAQLNDLDETVVDETEKDILKEYFKALENTNKSEDFPLYSVQVENTITNSNLNGVSKQKLLGVMATARYGVAYYN